MPWRRGGEEPATIIASVLKQMALFRAHPFLTAHNSLPNLHVNFPFSPDFVSHGNHAAQSRGAKRSSPFLFCKRGAAGEVSLVEEGSERVVMSEHGWSVRRIKVTETEMRRVAHVQAKAFHVAMPLFDDLLFEFFKVCAGQCPSLVDFFSCVCPIWFAFWVNHFFSRHNPLHN